MKCLQICNDFLGSKVHENLYKSLNELGVSQTIFYPLRKNKIDTLNKYHKDFNCEIITSRPLKKYHRVLFRAKINTLYKSLISQISENDFDVLHATTLFSDGAVALKYKREFNTPFILAIRSTDIDSFLKYRRDLIFLGLEILNESSKIIFISKVLKNKFLNHPLIKKHKSKFEHKCVIISNGIDPYWLNNQKSTFTPANPNKIIYVGTLIKRKNVDKLIQAVLDLNKKGIECSLTIVGKGGALQKKVENLAEINRPKIQYLGAIKDKEKLQEVYNNHQIFALPSRVETFGLVYLEAMSQGLPILYTWNEGIDGLFDFKIGEKCENFDINTISSKLETLINNHSNYEISSINFSDFSWNTIGKKYIKIYQNIVEKTSKLKG